MDDSGATEDVGQDMDLGGRPTTPWTDSLIFHPPFAAVGAAMRLDVGAVDRGRLRDSARLGQGHSMVRQKPRQDHLLNRL